MHFSNINYQSSVNQTERGSEGVDVVMQKWNGVNVYRISNSVNSYSHFFKFHILFSFIISSKYTVLWLDNDIVYDTIPSITLSLLWLSA